MRWMVKKNLLLQFVMGQNNILTGLSWERNLKPNYAYKLWRIGTGQALTTFKILSTHITKKKTKKKTTYYRNIWRETRALENIPPKELNVLLCRFFMDVCKKDGRVYEPRPLTSLQRIVQRYLNNNNSSTNVMKDKEFAKSREVLSARKRDFG